MSLTQDAVYDLFGRTDGGKFSWPVNIAVGKTVLIQTVEYDNQTFTPTANGPVRSGTNAFAFGPSAGVSSGGVGAGGVLIRTYIGKVTAAIGAGDQMTIFTTGLGSTAPPIAFRRARIRVLSNAKALATTAAARSEASGVGTGLNITMPKTQAPATPTVPAAYGVFAAIGAGRGFAGVDFSLVNSGVSGSEGQFIIDDGFFGTYCHLETFFALKAAAGLEQFTVDVSDHNNVQAYTGLVIYVEPEPTGPGTGVFNLRGSLGWFFRTWVDPTTNDVKVARVRAPQPPFDLTAQVTHTGNTQRPGLAEDHRQRLWLVWGDGTRVLAAYSDDDAATWSPGVSLFASGKYPFITADPATGALLAGAYVSGQLQLRLRFPGDADWRSAVTVKANGVVLAVEDDTFAFSFMGDAAGRLLLSCRKTGSASITEFRSFDPLGGTFAEI